jgi:hypothetical protein
MPFRIEWQYISFSGMHSAVEISDKITIKTKVNMRTITPT